MSRIQKPKHVAFQSNLKQLQNRKLFPGLWNLPRFACKGLALLTECHLKLWISDCWINWMKEGRSGSLCPPHKMHKFIGVSYNIKPKSQILNSARDLCTLKTKRMQSQTWLSGQCPPDPSERPKAQAMPHRSLHQGSATARSKSQGWKLQNLGQCDEGPMPEGWGICTGVRRQCASLLQKTPSERTIAIPGNSSENSTPPTRRTAVFISRKPAVA